MILDRDSFEAASRVINHHGKNAQRFALGRKIEAEDSDDEIGTVAWRRILAAIEEIERNERVPGEGLN